MHHGFARSSKLRALAPAKKQLAIRPDEGVLAGLKRHGNGYQTRINRILRRAAQIVSCHITVACVWHECQPNSHQCSVNLM